MPLIRLARDKRGLDTLYLLHPRTDTRGDTRLRVLYFSASPQGATFGRSWLDADTQRALERQYPDVDFDWPALLKELDQRRLPPAIEPQIRRPKALPKADRRPPSSEVPVEKGGASKRKRRRSAVPAIPAADQASTASVPISNDETSSVAPIIEEP